MTTSTNSRIGAALCRGIVTTSILVTALALRAQQSELDKPKQDASSTSQATRAGDPATCIQEAAKMNMATIKFGQLASQKAQSAELKRFGKTLESDHKKAQAKLETIAKTHNVTLPTSLEAKCEEELTKLQSVSGSEFDKEFMKGAVEGHAMALAHLEQATTKAKDPDVAQYVKDMLARVKDHQQRAREVAKAVGLDQATIESLESKAKEGVGSAGVTSETSRGTGSSKNPNKSDQQDRPASPREP